MYQQYLGFGIIVAIMVLLIVYICYTYFWSPPFCSGDHQQTQDTHLVSPGHAFQIELVEVVSGFTYGSLSRPSCEAEAEVCIICLNEYVQEDIVQVLPRCKHMFHKDCLYQWVRMRSFTCPICREA